MVFADGSWLFFKWDSAVVGRDENGPIGKGTGTILKGTGQYEGINGKVVFTNRVLKDPPRAMEANAELTYTIGAGPVQPKAVPAGTPFTGTVTRPSSSDLSIGRVWFEPGSRTHWHSHPNGQMIMVEKGRGRIQKQGERITNLSAGEAVFTGPNIMHWHGAAPDQPMTQVTIGFGGTTQWGEEVTEEQYSGKVNK
jgi:quercetin dioxygenase-like cupin family protein